jgi:hypothetical protein
LIDQSTDDESRSPQLRETSIASLSPAPEQKHFTACAALRALPPQIVPARPLGDRNLDRGGVRSQQPRNRNDVRAARNHSPVRHASRSFFAPAAVFQPRVQDNSIETVGGCRSAPAVTRSLQ